MTTELELYEIHDCAWCDKGRARFAPAYYLGANFGGQDFGMRWCNKQCFDNWQGSQET